jgi:hypothetical protein
MLLLASVATWRAFPTEVRGSFNAAQRATLLTFGMLIGFALYALMRSRIEANKGGLVVVNGFRRREYAWPEVIALRLLPGAPWAALDLADGTSVPAMGIQSSDGARARRAVAEVRGLLA